MILHVVDLQDSNQDSTARSLAMNMNIVQLFKFKDQAPESTCSKCTATLKHDVNSYRQHRGKTTTFPSARLCTGRAFGFGDIKTMAENCAHSDRRTRNRPLPTLSGESPLFPAFLRICMGRDNRPSFRLMSASDPPCVHWVASCHVLSPQSHLLLFEIPGI